MPENAALELQALKDKLREQAEAHALELQALRDQHSLELQALRDQHSLELQALRDQHSLELQALKDQLREQAEAHSLELQRIRDEGIPYGPWQQRECPICYEFLCNKSRCFLRCRHFFHYDCLDSWARSTVGVGLCPVCRVAY